jgi:hypothetical protein
MFGGVLGDILGSIGASTLSSADAALLVLSSSEGDGCEK